MINYIRYVLDFKEELHRVLSKELASLNLIFVLLPGDYTPINDARICLLKRAYKFFSHILPYPKKQIFLGSTESTITSGDDFLVVTTPDQEEGVAISLGLGRFPDQFTSSDGKRAYPIDAIRIELMPPTILQRLLEKQKGK